MNETGYPKRLIPHATVKAMRRAIRDDLERRRRYNKLRFTGFVLVQLALLLLILLTSFELSPFRILWGRVAVKALFACGMILFFYLLRRMSHDEGIQTSLNPFSDPAAIIELLGAIPAMWLELFTGSDWSRMSTLLKRPETLVLPLMRHPWPRQLAELDDILPDQATTPVRRTLFSARVLVHEPEPLEELVSPGRAWSAIGDRLLAGPTLHQRSELAYNMRRFATVDFDLPITEIAVDHEGERLALLDIQGRIRVCDAQGNVEEEFQAPTKSLLRLRFDGVGRIWALDERRRFCCWDSRAEDWYYPVDEIALDFLPLGAEPYIVFIEQQGRTMIWREGLPARVMLVHHTSNTLRGNPWTGFWLAGHETTGGFTIFSGAHRLHEAVLGEGFDDISMLPFGSFVAGSAGPMINFYNVHLRQRFTFAIGADRVCAALLPRGPSVIVGDGKGRLSWLDMDGARLADFNTTGRVDRIFADPDGERFWALVEGRTLCHFQANVDIMHQQATAQGNLESVVEVQAADDSREAPPIPASEVWRKECTVPEGHREREELSLLIGPEGHYSGAITPADGLVVYARDGRRFRYRHEGGRFLGRPSAHTFCIEDYRGLSVYRLTSLDPLLLEGSPRIVDSDPRGVLRLAILHPQTLHYLSDTCEILQRTELPQHVLDAAVDASGEGAWLLYETGRLEHRNLLGKVDQSYRLEASRAEIQEAQQRLIENKRLPDPDLLAPFDGGCFALLGQTAFRVRGGAVEAVGRLERGVGDLLQHEGGVVFCDREKAQAFSATGEFVEERQARSGRLGYLWPRGGELLEIDIYEDTVYGMGAGGVGRMRFDTDVPLLGCAIDRVGRYLLLLTQTDIRLISVGEATQPSTGDFLEI